MTGKIRLRTEDMCQKVCELFNAKIEAGMMSSEDMQALIKNGIEENIIEQLSKLYSHNEITEILADSAFQKDKNKLIRYLQTNMQKMIPDSLRSHNSLLLEYELAKGHINVVTSAIDELTSLKDSLTKSETTDPYNLENAVLSLKTFISGTLGHTFEAIETANDSLDRASNFIKNMKFLKSGSSTSLSNVTAHIDLDLPTAINKIVDVRREVRIANTTLMKMRDNKSKNIILQLQEFANAVENLQGVPDALSLVGNYIIQEERNIKNRNKSERKKIHSLKSAYKKTINEADNIHKSIYEKILLVNKNVNPNKL